MMATFFDGGSSRSVPPTAPLKRVADDSSDFLAGVKMQLRRNYSEALETSLPDDLATLIGQLDEAP